MSTEVQEVTLYSQPACVQCNTTKQALKKRGWEEDVHYKVVDMSENEQALERVKGLGFMRAPVMEVKLTNGMTDFWSGMNPGKIEEHFGPSLS